MKRFIGPILFCGVVNILCSQPLLAHGGHGGAAAGGGHVHANAGGGGGQVNVGGFNHNVGTTVHQGGNLSSGFPAPSSGFGQSPFGGQPAVNNAPAISSPATAVHHHTTNGTGAAPQIGGFTSSLQPSFTPASASGIGTSLHFGHAPQVNVGQHGGNLGSSPQGAGQSGASSFAPGSIHSAGWHRHFDGNPAGSVDQHHNHGNTGNSPEFHRHPDHGHWDVNQGQAVTNGSANGGHERNHHHGNRPLNQVSTGSGGYAASGGSGGFVGFGGLGFGSWPYDSGYMVYLNPYYNSVDLSGGIYNYTQPIPVSNYTRPYVNGSTASVVRGSTQEDAILNFAVASFKTTNFDRALEIIDLGISQYPDDAVLHEFRALVLFAMGDYQQAAATIHAVLAVGPGWNWATLISCYGNSHLHTVHLRALEATVKRDPQDAAARFVLAYQYLVCGFPEAAARQLRRVVALQPNDQVAADLLRTVSPAPGSPASESTAQPTPEPPSAELSPEALSRVKSAVIPIDPATMMGTWHASRADGSNFDITLMKDQTFQWKFTAKNQQSQSFEGVYSVQGNLITLERNGGGLLVAEITSGDAAHFNFKLAGAPTIDPGLDFSRATSFQARQ